MIDDLCNQMRQGLGGEETRPPLSVGFRESVKKIKSEFQRYL
jgi:hypothetical protein